MANERVGDEGAMAISETFHCRLNEKCNNIWRLAMACT